MTRRTGFSAAVAELVLARSQGNCECMATGCEYIATQLHHRRPRAAGGTRRPETNQASNALYLCHRCHERIEAQRAWALDNGFLVPQNHDPKTVAVWWRCNTRRNRKRMVLLDNTGHLYPCAVRKPA